MLKSLEESFDLFGREVFAHASVGVALGRGCDGGGELLRRADLALYTAKRHGKGRMELFNSSMHDDAMARLDLRVDLRRAIERSEFVPHYQPIYNLRTRRIVGVEALVRWHHPDRGLVQPSDFVPLAEQMGLIVPIDLWMLNQACRQAAAWHRWHVADPRLKITVNISAKHFEHPGLVEDVRFALAQSGLDPRALVLEVTEGIFLHDSSQTIATLHALKGLGVSLAIDDFGTGYASLSYLKRFPVDILKIDKVFIDSIANGPEDAALAHAVIRLGRTLGLEVVAEGVERSEQVAKLRHQGCELAQGFFFAHPSDPAGINILLTDENDELRATAG
jgi:EAL domain-containing protein (putative c-di-GMP-specific phosphodiesterase class I)